MSKAPKVLHVVYNLSRGGTEGQCARAATGLARRGEVHRIAVTAREGFFLDAVEAVCGPVHETGISRLVSMDTARRVRGLAGRIRDEQIDLVHTWDADAAIFGSAGARMAGVPFITSRRDLGEIYPRWKLRLMRRADRGARAVVVNAKAIGERVREEGIDPSRIHRLSNIVDVAGFDAPVAQPVSRVLPTPAVVLVSRLDDEKDVPTFLRAAAKMTVGSMVIAGGGNRDALTAMADGLGVGARVVFLGAVQNVPALLRQATVGVLVPKSNEGLSNAILEYMAAGLPVVATDCGGNAELVRDGENGYVVPIGDPRALAAALAKLLAEPELANKMGHRSREIVEQEFEAETILDQFSTLYRRFR